MAAAAAGAEADTGYNSRLAKAVIWLSQTTANRPRCNANPDGLRNNGHSVFTSCVSGLWVLLARWVEHDTYNTALQQKEPGTLESC